MTAASSLITAVCQKRPQLTAVCHIAVKTYRGTLKQNRDVSIVKSRGFEKVRHDRGELRDLKTTIFSWYYILRSPDDKPRSQNNLEKYQYLNDRSHNTELHILMLTVS